MKSFYKNKTFLTLVGIPSPVFSHIQLCVGFTRLTSKENIRIKIQQTEIQRKIEAKSDNVFTINCVNREIFFWIKSFSAKEIEIFLIKTVPPKINSKQMDIDSISNSKKREYLISDSECDSESDSVDSELLRRF
jgi:hypothetical protein